MSLDIRELRRDEWAEAMTVAARAFTNMGFIVDMFGADSLTRFALTREFYAATPWVDANMHLGAFIGDDLVGAVVATPPGKCQLCLHDSVYEAQLPDDEREWLGLARATHTPLDPHARIGRLVVEPALQGAGLGSRLLATALEHLAAHGADLVVLECEMPGEPFYTERGFSRLAVITEPGRLGDGSTLAGIDLRPTLDPE